MNWSVLGHYMLAADIHTRRSIGQIGLFPAVRGALVEDPFRPTTRLLQHHSSHTFSRCPRMTSKP
jgi:hypothetical protein